MELTALYGTANGSCGFTETMYGNYTYDASDEQFLNASSCEFSDCTGDCQNVCDASSYCLVPEGGQNETEEVNWTSDCESFYFSSLPTISYHYESTSANWLPWVLLGVVLVVIIVAVAAVVVAGFMYWKKKKATADA